MMFRLTDDEILEIVKGFKYSSKGAPPQWWRHEYPKFSIATVKKIADKIEDMANDGDSVGDVLKALREET